MTNWKIQAAKDPETSPQILSSLLDSPECHEYLIKNPSTPTGVLAALGVKEAFTSDPMNRRMQVAEVLSKREIAGRKGRARCPLPVLRPVRDI